MGASAQVLAAARHDVAVARARLAGALEGLIEERRACVSA
jgi:hypothetical protein